MSTASACGKTTLGQALARRMGARFVELDALVQGPGWAETPDDALRAALEPLLAEPSWVVDGNYRKKVGDVVLARADLVVWLDLPITVWLPRLVRRSLVRWARRHELWNGNRESLRGIFWGRDSMIGYALANHRRRRDTEFPQWLAPYPHERLRTPAAVARFLARF